MLQRVFQVKYLNDDQIKGFDHYKYSSVDNSPLSMYVSHPLWNQIVKLFPEWLAPNVLTMAGFLLVMLAFGIVSYYDYYLLASSLDVPGWPPVPAWVWLFCSIATEVAHILDGVDGKQARRTGSSGPTGELFDHGLDSWSTVPFSVTVLSIFGCHDFSAPPIRLLLCLISVQVVFIVTHWEKYNTGVLYLPMGYDLSQYGLAVFYVITFFVGYKYWKFFVSTTLGITFGNVAEASFYVTCVSSVVMSVYNIQNAYTTTKTGRQSSLYECVLPLMSSTTLFALAVAYAHLSPTHVIDVDPRAFFWTMGTVFANIACRLIVAQMTGTRCETLNALLLPYSALFLLSVTHWLGEYELGALRALAIAVTLLHVHYGVCVVKQMCDHFDIQCFSLEYKRHRSENDQLKTAASETSDKIDGGGAADGKKQRSDYHMKGENAESVLPLLSTEHDA